jgi:hypothetical protein
MLALCLGGACNARTARAGVPSFWQRLARCETDGRWDWGAGQRAGEGPTFVGGLGIYQPNWESWRIHVSVEGPAWRATPEEQARVAAWGWLHTHAWWGCFRETGTPDATALVVLRPATPRGRTGPPPARAAFRPLPLDLLAVRWW